MPRFSSAKLPQLLVTGASQKKNAGGLQARCKALQCIVRATLAEKKLLRILINWACQNPSHRRFPLQRQNAVSTTKKPGDLQETGWKIARIFFQVRNSG
jgi:hypothetical protein